MSLYGAWLTLSGSRWRTERRRVAWFAGHPPQPPGNLQPWDDPQARAVPSPLPWFRGPGPWGRLLIRVDTWQDNRFWRQMRTRGIAPAKDGCAFCDPGWLDEDGAGARR